MTVVPPPGATPVVPATPVEQNFDQLGYFLDGWSDLVEGMGEKAETVRNAVLENLCQRQLKNVTVENVSAYLTARTWDRRQFFRLLKTPGFSTTVYIDQRGNDLYVSWKSFYQPVLNPQWIVILLVISAIIALIVVASSRLFGFIGWLIITLLLFLIGLGLLEKAGRFLKGDPQYFFIQQPQIFDADDVIASNLAVHKTLLHVLDAKGIDVSKLRLKQEFKGGRRDENV